MSGNSRRERPETVAVLGVRLLGLVLLTLGTALLIDRGIEWSAEYDAVFRDEFTWRRGVPALTGALLGGLLWSLSRPLGRRLARGLSYERTP
jgi:hypothetical protein